MFRTAHQSLQPYGRAKLKIELRRLHPFRDLPGDKYREAIAAARWVEVRPGQSKVFHDPSRIFYLYAGTLGIRASGSGPFRLDASHPASRFSLPRGPGTEFETTNPARLISLPRRFESLIRQRSAPQHEQAAQTDLLSEELVERLYDRFRQGRCELPSLPDLALRIGKAINDPRTSTDKIGRLIQTDPALSARMLSLVNSAAFGTSRKIQSINRAVVRLGRARTRNLVYSCIIGSLFHTKAPLLRKRIRTLWAHSSRVGAISFVLAKHTPGLDPDRALLAGLTHDIGIVPIVTEAKHFPELVDNATRLEAAISVLRRNVSVLTLKKWHLGDDLADAAVHAENWFRAGSAVPDYADVVILSQMHAFIGTTLMAQLPRVDSIPAYEKLALGQLTPRHSIEILDKADRDIDEVSALLNSI